MLHEAFCQYRQVIDNLLCSAASVSSLLLSEQVYRKQFHAVLNATMLC